MYYIIILMLIIIVSFLTVKLYLLKKQLRSILGQMREQSKQFILVDFVDKDLEAVTIQINEMIDFVLKIKAEAAKGEQKIKSAVSMISHDMRTPLTSVIGYLQLAEQNCEEEEVLQDIRIALDRAKYCNKLVNDFFELSVIDSKTYTPVMENVDICSVVCEEILANYPGFEKKQITPVFEQSDEVVLVRADKKMLARVIQNLISNTIKYASGNVKFSVIMDLEALKATLAIESLATQKVKTEKIFDKFYREDNARGSNGTGLGLYICRKFVEDMNGNISAENRENTFCIKIELELSERF